MNIQGGEQMTIEELREALAKIPARGAINKARRRAIIEMINRLMAEGQ